MPPKKKGKKGKKGKKKKKEPKHDAGWQKALINGKWERPLEALPDPFLWPSFGEIREKILLSSHLISILWSGSIHDDFILELLKVPRPNLTTLELRGTKYLTRFVMSPPSVCPVLETLDLACCPILEYVLIESTSLESVSFKRCVSLNKALLNAKKLKQIDLHETGQLDCLMLWSDAIEELHFFCKEMTQLELCCPKLTRVQRPSIKVIPPLYPVHPSVLDIVRVDNAPRAKEYSHPFVIEEYKPYARSPFIPQAILLCPHWDLSLFIPIHHFIKATISHQQQQSYSIQTSGSQQLAGIHFRRNEPASLSTFHQPAASS
ncbi:hypothetical protein SELMODRAFT_412677 [Selaginella moellendorffii]|uniref:Uncharacterized protein n=1 Tax=Selaginella moellendorffii TaxID=88036 RepID=D8RL45_SELML|nr:hypothetical protein SELMODRAFT_412677 [Selaginella moellendorffii]